MQGRRIARKLRKRQLAKEKTVKKTEVSTDADLHEIYPSGDVGELRNTSRSWVTDAVSGYANGRRETTKPRVNQTGHAETSMMLIKFLSKKSCFITSALSIQLAK